MDRQPPVLSYARSTRSWKRSLRRTVVVTALFVVGYISWKSIGRAYWEGRECYQAQAIAIEHKPGSDWVVHTETDVTGEGDRGRGITRSSSTRNVPGPWWDLWVACNVNWPDLVYIGERKSPTGRSRLVAVSRAIADGVIGYREDPPYFPVERWTLSLSAVSLLPATRVDPPRAMRQTPFAVVLLVPKSGSLEIFAGESDVRDPSHFTIGIRDGAFSDVVDGWLQDDDTVRMTPRTAKSLKLLVE